MSEEIGIAAAALVAAGVIIALRRRAARPAPKEAVKPAPKRRRPSRRSTPAPEAPAPGPPVAFGYKCSWLAIRAEADDAVRAALPLDDAVPCDWVLGIHAAYQGDTFVSPPVGGWVFVVSTSVPETGPKLADLVVRLSRELDTVVQAFGTHRVVDYHGWALADRGELKRMYGWLGEQGRVLRDEGDATPAERDALRGDDRPSEATVMRVAAAWSLDPQTLEDREEIGIGWLGGELSPA